MEQTDRCLLPKKPGPRRLDRSSVKIITHIFTEQAREGPLGHLKPVSLKAIVSAIGYGGSSTTKAPDLLNADGRLHYHRIAVDLGHLSKVGVLNNGRHGYYTLNTGLFKYLYERTGGDPTRIHIPALSKMLTEKGV